MENLCINQTTDKNIKKNFQMYVAQIKIHCC